MCWELPPVTIRLLCFAVDPMGARNAQGPDPRGARRMRWKSHVELYVERTVMLSVCSAAWVSLLIAISGGEPLSIIGRFDRGSRVSASEIRQHERCESGRRELLLWGVIAYVAGVLGRVARWRPPLTGDGSPRLSATDRAARPPRRPPIMLSDPRTDFDLSRTNAIQTPPYST